MERLTDKNHRAINTCGEYSSCYSCHKETCYIKEMEEKLGELEDVLEKYGIESAEELDGVLKPLIDNGELENWKSAIFWKTQTEKLEQELAELKQKSNVLEKALEFAVEIANIKSNHFWTSKELKEKAESELKGE